MISVIAKTIVYAEPAVSSAGLSASDIVAICSLVVAVLALGFSIVSAEAQRRHNIRVARPHVEIDVGLNSHLVRLTNHGPGVARIAEFKANTGEKEFSFLSISQSDAFCTWIASNLENQIRIDRTCPSPGCYLAPNCSIDLIVADPELGIDDAQALFHVFSSVEFTLHVSSIYDKSYVETFTPGRHCL